MGVELIKPLVDIAPFPVLPVVEGNFFGVAYQLGVQRAVFSFEFLLNSSQASERRRDHLDNDRGNCVPAEDHRGSLPADQFCQLLRKQEDIEDRLCYVEIKG